MGYCQEENEKQETKKMQMSWRPLSKKRLGYVRNPRSLMEGTETLCRDDIGDLPGSPEHLWLRENANEIG